MDVCVFEQKPQKQYTSSNAARKPLVPAENKNGSTRPRTREIVSSRYKSPIPSSIDGSKRCPSPNAGRASSVPGAKRSLSAERNRISRTSSPTPPSTPVQDTDILPASRKIGGSKLPQESLWPSTMRSLSVSFQSDTISVPISKKEKQIPIRKVESSSSRRPVTQERKKSPSKGKNSSVHTENVKPVESLRSRLVDQHHWPSRTSGIVSSSAMNRSIDLTDKKSETSSARRLSLDVASRPLEKSSSDLLLEMISHDFPLRISQRPGSSSSSNRAQLANLRSSSPSLTRGLSPVRGKVVSSSSRGPSPARARPSRQQPQSTDSVLSFMADIKKGQKAANHVDDVHQLRMLYNRHLQWRYTNARTYASLDYQKLKAENLLYSVWEEMADLRESVRKKRVALQQLGIKSKLCSVLNDQMTCLDGWASIEMDHANSLNFAIQDLKANTIRIPVTGGARGDVESVKNAISAAVDVMQTMGSSICSLLPQVEGMSRLVSQLAGVSAHERAMLDQCQSLLSSTTATQVTEDSLRIHVLQSLEKW